MLHHTDFRDLVLITPAMQGANGLKIISGYAMHTMASWHISEIASRCKAPIDITLIVGMCPFDGISNAVHAGFRSIMRRNNTMSQSNFVCQYVTDGTPVHSKLYLWERGGAPFRAFIGSANYTQSAFSTIRRELIQECDPNGAAEYFESIEANTMYCNHAEIEDRVRIVSSHSVLEAEENPLVSIRGADVESVTLSLLARGNETGTRSGLNWGQRGKREPNQAYIPLPAAVARSGFFPLAEQHFSVLTDDRIQLILRVEQQNDKAITTPLNNSLIGEYFRRRIGVANGTYVNRRDLEQYGRTSVTFYKLDDEHFFMDFSV